MREDDGLDYNEDEWFYDDHLNSGRCLIISKEEKTVRSVLKSLVTIGMPDYLIDRQWVYQRALFGPSDALGHVRAEKVLHQHDDLYILECQVCGSIRSWWEPYSDYEPPDGYDNWAEYFDNRYM